IPAPMDRRRHLLLDLFTQVPHKASTSLDVSYGEQAIERGVEPDLGTPPTVQAVRVGLWLEVAHHVVKHFTVCSKNGKSFIVSDTKLLRKRTSPRFAVPFWAPVLRRKAHLDDYSGCLFGNPGIIGYRHVEHDFLEELSFLPWREVLVS